MSDTQRSAPILDALANYTKQESVSFSVPGHKSGQGAPADVKRVVGAAAFTADATTQKGVPRCLVWVAPHAQVAPVLSTKQPIERSPSVPGAASAGLFGAPPLAWLRADQ